MSAKLKMDRTNPLIVPIGIESALILCGQKVGRSRNEFTLVKQAEIIDTR